MVDYGWGASPALETLHRYKPHEHWVLPVTKGVTKAKRGALRGGDWIDGTME
jgi:hypothetical protein